MSTHSVPIISARVGEPTVIDLGASCKFTISRHITTLFKEFLLIVEQLAEEHDEALGKLHDALPPEYSEYVNLADHFTEEKGDRIRRAILARGNDCRRSVCEELDQFNLTFRDQPPSP